MRKIYLALFVIIFFVGLVSASSVGLIENSTWQGNLTEVKYPATAFGDIDNDGDQDLAVIGCFSDGANDCENGVIAKIYTNNGTSLIENKTWQQNLTAIGIGSLAWIDIDNDGDLDLALSGCNSSQSYSCNGEKITKIYINNGTSLVENSQWQNNLSAFYYSSMAFGDIDNDGKFDLVINGVITVRTTKVYLNNGTSLVENSQWQNGLKDIKEGQVVLGDIDNDGDLDLALTGDPVDSSSFISIYINNGTSFVESSQWKDNLITLTLSSLLFGDYDNDGDLDLMSCGLAGGDYCYLYKNNGSTFELNQSRDDALLGIFRSSIAFGDYDNDGDLDFFGAGREAGRAKTLENNETNNYYFQNDALAHSNISDYITGGSSLSWVDIDNDMDLDLLVIGLDYNDGLISKIFINNNTVSNTKPISPTDNFSSTYTNNVLTLDWGNGSDSETPTLGLYYNLMIGNSTNNHTIVSGIYGGSSGGGGGAGGGASGYFGNMMQRKNITLNLELEANATYYWYVQTIDTGLAKSNWSEAQNFTTGLDISKPNVTLNNPSPNASLHTTNASFVFNVTITDANLTNVTLYADFNGTMIANETNSSGLNGTYTFTKNISDKNDGMYSWYIYACDGDSNCKSSGTRAFYLDRAYPIVNSISPSNGYASGSASVTFSYNVSDTDIANCSLIIGGSVANTSSSVVEDTTQTFTNSLSNGVYNWYVNCTDYVGYTNSSSSRSLTVSYTAPTTPSGGGGGGGGTTIITPIPEVKEFDVDFSTAETGIIKTEQGDIKTFSFQGEITHKITVTEVTTNSIKLIIESEPIILILNIGETKQIDINNDNINDLEIKLASIINGVADLLLRKLEGADIVGQEEIEEAIKKEALFDAKVSISNLFKIIKSGRDVIANIEVLNVNNIGQVDVLVNYYITDKENNTLAEGSDTLAVEAVASFVRSLKIPYNTKSGVYSFNVDVKYQDMMMASGHAEFRIMRNYEIIIAVSVIVLIIVAIFFYLWRIKRKEEKDIGMLKRQISKLKKKKQGKNKKRSNKKWQK